MQGKMAEKRAEKRGRDSLAAEGGEGVEETKSKKQRVFKQRPRVEEKAGTDALQGVLSNLFA